MIHYLFSCNYNGGSIVTTAIKEACGTNKLKIREIDNTLGDLGKFYLFIYNISFLFYFFILNNICK